MTSFISHFLDCGYWTVGGSFEHNYDGKDFKNFFCTFLISYQTGVWQTLKIYNFIWMTLTLRESTEKLRNLNSLNLSTMSSQRNQKVKDFKVWKSQRSQQYATHGKSCFGLQHEDNDRFKLLFETGSNLKWMWQFIYLSFMD